ncbi:MAG: hypothetical protein E6J79_06435 [Deltaproteobacteria bacterium]|nr:MAG: hypothetical protein E6J79_06435 [Deltaproteobacteria bacterium]
MAVASALVVATAMSGVAADLVSAPGPKARPPVYLVGGGVRSINPTSEMLANDDFYLGGYGFGDFKAANQVQIPTTSGRFATGILADGVSSRALAVSDGLHTIVLAQIETQGYFAVYKQGPFGINEIRQDAAAQIAVLAANPPELGNSGKLARVAPAPDASEILVDSDHSHGGPDTVGVWGGVPTSYLKLVHDQTVSAIVDAWRNLKPAQLRYGVAHAGVVGEEAQFPPTGGSDPVLTNQFSNDPNNQVMDDEIRVLQASDPDSGAVLATYVNYSAHPTVLGSSNTKVTGDYVGRLDDLIEQTYGGFGFDQVATLGREQPARSDCPGFTGGDANPDAALCKLDNYASRVLAKVQAAVAAAQPLSGTPQVAMNSYLLIDPSTSTVLVSVVYAGAVVGVPVGRAENPPWLAGSLIGTTVFTGRIGDVLVTGGPGEMYAQIWQKVRDTVTGLRGYLNVGTAGDFLGYIIAPLEAYPEPIRRSFFSGDPPPAGANCSSVPSPVGCPSPIGNDNYFFNVSHTFGERLTCDFLRGAGDVLAGDALKFWTTDERCPAFANDLALPPGFDTQFPQQPDLSGVMPHM